MPLVKTVWLVRTAAVVSRDGLVPRLAEPARCRPALCFLTRPTAPVAGGWASGCAGQRLVARKEKLPNSVSEAVHTNQGLINRVRVSSRPKMAHRVTEGSLHIF